MRLPSNFHRVLVLAVLLGSLALPTAASSIALAGPCVQGAVYDAACDVNHDGIIDVVDIQLTAGHWSQSGPYTADGWLLTGNTGTNPATNFLGTTDAQPLVLKVNNQPALRLEPTSGPNNSPNIIVGYPSNFVTAGAYASTISGGGDNNPAGMNTVTDSYGTVGGGSGNRSGDGLGSTFDATGATVAGGIENTASASWAVVGGGQNNNASGQHAVVDGGLLNRATGDYSSVPGGQRARASHYGEMAYASGSFGVQGSAQASSYVLRREIPSNAGNRELFLDGSDGSSERITLAINRALAFDVLIVARSNTGETSAWRVEGVVENSGGTTALIGTPIKTTLGEDDVAWDVAVLADNANDALTVVGYSNQSGDTIRFVASVRTTEVAW